MQRLTVRHETVQLRGIRRKLRVLHLSDVHFSPSLSYEKNLLRGKRISDTAKSERPDIIVMTGDLVSRSADAQSIRAAEMTATHLCSIAPVLLSLGNHEIDLPEQQQKEFLASMQRAGVTVLHNDKKNVENVVFTGITLPGEVFKNEKGGYSALLPVTKQLVTDCVGECPAHPCVLLAHLPMGFPAYAEWGADAVLSGHVHGGIIRIGKIGLLSPERKFIPTYTKGLYYGENSIMNVSAGIGKLRFNNPAEAVSIEFVPEEG